MSSLFIGINIACFNSEFFMYNINRLFTEINMTKISVGIDIGCNAIKLVELKHSLFGSTIINYGIKVLPFNPSGDTIIAALAELINETPLLTNEVKLSVSGSNVNTQFAVFPALSKDELINLVKHHFEKLVPFPPSECVVDLDIINKEPNENVKVLIVSSRKDFVEQKVQTVKNAQLTPIMICLDAMVLHKLFTNCKLHNKQKSYCLVNINEDKANLLIIRDGNPIRIQDILNWKDPVSLCREIKVNVQTAIQEGTCEKIDEVFLCGDMETMIATEKHLCSDYALTTYRWNPFNNFKISKELNFSEKKAYQLALALAVANA